MWCRVSRPRTRSEIGAAGWRVRVQLLCAALFNSYYLAPGGKYLCLPVLNCYACPIGAVSCPVGSLTAFALLRRIPFYIIGFLGLLGLGVGRGFCGWACPFGLLQDALYRVRSRKWQLPAAADKLKYVLLVVLVIGLPLILGGGKGKGAQERIIAEKTGAVDYCALVCPAGTLEAGLPSLARDPQIRARASWRTWSKIGILLAVLGLVVVSRRSFCRALCPLGALMALSWGTSLLRLDTDEQKCSRCMRCAQVCPTAARMVPDAAGDKEASSECIMCLDCVRACPESGALAARLAGRSVMTSRGNRDA